MFLVRSGRGPTIRSLTIVSLVVSVLLISAQARAQLSIKVHHRTSGVASSSDASETPRGFIGDTSALSAIGPTYHILPADTEAGRHAALSGPAERMAPLSVPAIASGPLAGLARPGFFPADLSVANPGSALVIGSLDSEDIYYNCPSDDETCWGDPEGFLLDLSISKFIHVVDQYVGSKVKIRYPLSDTVVTIDNGPTSLNTALVEEMVHNAAALNGVGPDHIFHLFLPQGVDVCSSPGNCYSPDNPSTFVFCAYHSFTSGDDIPYTVEPFQDVVGCRVAPPNPNSPMIDSTNSALSHELFEIITDPFPGTTSAAWVAHNSSPESGNEIADVCHGPGDGTGQVIVPSYVLVKGRSYQTQLEYSNARHGCVVAP